MEGRAVLLDEIGILVEQGIYKDRDSLLRDALRSLLRSKPELRQRLAVELYARGKVSLSRAAEISGSDIENFKELLREKGITRVIKPIGEEELARETDLIAAIRDSNGSGSGNN